MRHKHTKVEQKPDLLCNNNDCLSDVLNHKDNMPGSPLVEFYTDGYWDNRVQLKDEKKQQQNFEKGPE